VKYFGMVLEESEVLKLSDDPERALKFLFPHKELIIIGRSMLIDILKVVA
jgi:hypothetical protein